MPLPPAVPAQHQGFATTYRVPSGLPIGYVQADAPPPAEDSYWAMFKIDTKNSKQVIMVVAHVAVIATIGALVYALYKKKKMPTY